MAAFCYADEWRRKKDISRWIRFFYRIHRFFCIYKIVIWRTKSEFSQSKSIFLKIILDNGRNFASVKKDNNPSKKIELYQTIQKETIILLKKNRVIFSYFSMGG